MTKKFIIGGVQYIEKLDDNRLHRIADWFYAHFSHIEDKKEKVEKLEKASKGKNPYEVRNNIHIFKNHN